MDYSNVSATSCEDFLTTGGTDCAQFLIYTLITMFPDRGGMSVNVGPFRLSLTAVCCKMRAYRHTISWLCGAVK